jgi:hypothetical protein
MIIGLSGYPNSGKSTIRDHVVDKHNFHGTSVAKNLKLLCSHCFSLSNNDVFTQEGKERQVTVNITEWAITEFLLWINKTHHIPKHQIQNVITALHGIPEVTTPRYVLQYVGTEVIRNLVSSSYHMDVLKHEISNYKNVIIDDIRYPNETVLCDWVVLVKRIGNTYIPKHASDALFPDDNYDFMISANDGCINDLIEQIDFYIESKRTWQK